MKTTLTEIENTLQGINSGVEEAKNESSDSKDKEAVNNPNSKMKKESKKMRIV